VSAAVAVAAVSPFRLDASVPFSSCWTAAAAAPGLILLGTATASTAASASALKASGKPVALLIPLILLDLKAAGLKCNTIGTIK
jgi:hypothetical protein